MNKGQLKKHYSPFGWKIIAPPYWKKYECGFWSLIPTKHCSAHNRWTHTMEKDEVTMTCIECNKRYIIDSVNKKVYEQTPAEEIKP